MQSTARLTRILPYALVGAAAGYLYYVAANIQYHARAGTLGPDFWPKAILLLTIAMCVYEVVKLALLGSRARDAGGVLEELVEEGPQQSPETGPAGTAEKNHPFLLLAGMGATLAYVWASQRLGFFLATVVYLIAFMALGGYRRWRVVVAVSVVGTFVLLFIFMKLVYVSLPIGVAPFSEVTLFLMKLMAIR
ncbi:MAG TPA: tripartite tricarboxylate transporter TctB family protein [Burkholderiales bacterium]|nr:tripartite tricarboxylate transporter TctB family protein [Burkholderiales bacterium]